MNNKFLKYLQLLLTIALVVFIALKAGDFFRKIDWQVIADNWLMVVFSGVLFVCGYLFLAWHWLAVCRLVDSKTSPKQWLAFFASQPYKYLPTSIFTFSSRAHFASKFGMSLKHSTQAQVIENLNLIGSALITGVILLLLLTNILLSLVITLVVVAVVLLLWRQKSLVVLKLPIDLRKWVSSLGIVTVGWLVIGLGFFVMALGLEGRFEPVLAIAASNLATGLGIAAFFAPGGIGVRELVFATLSFASGTILIWRLVTFAVDILFGTWATWTISRGQR